MRELRFFSNLPKSAFLFNRGVNLNVIPYGKLFDKTLISRYFHSDLIPANIPLVTSRDIVIKTMGKQDLKTAFSWAQQENWNLGLNEIEFFYRTDPLGYRMLWVDGEPVASLASVKYDGSYVFFGLYIVAPGFRGQGYGKLLWDVAMHAVTPCTVMGLNGVMNQIARYEKEGFCFSNLNTRWSGHLFNPLVGSAYLDSDISFSCDVSFSEVVDFDAKAFSVARPRFWEGALRKPGSFYFSHKSQGKLTGFAMVSPCPDGYKIGPVYADNPKIARELIIQSWQYARTQAVKESVTIQLDTSDKNPSAALIAEKLGLRPTLQTARMYKGCFPFGENDKVFGLSSLEIG